MTVVMQFGFGLFETGMQRPKEDCLKVLMKGYLCISMIKYYIVIFEPNWNIWRSAWLGPEQKRRRDFFSGKGERPATTRLSRSPSRDSRWGTAEMVAKLKISTFSGSKNPFFRRKILDKLKIFYTNFLSYSEKLF